MVINQHIRVGLYQIYAVKNNPLYNYRSLSSSYGSPIKTSSSSNIQNVIIFGSGIAGTGIAQVAASHGNNVNLVDIDANLLKRSKLVIEKSLQRMAKKQFKDEKDKREEFVQMSLERINFTSDQKVYKKAIETCDLVIEAISENIQLKQNLFAKIDKLAPEKTIFASNTSSNTIKEIAKTTQRKDRFGGLHFFSPVPLMRLIEIVRISETNEDTYRKMENWGKSIGKVTVSCKDSPGFIVNRLIIPYLVESIQLLERGDAGVEDIDKAMKFGAGYPLGPFELLDFVGIDTVLDILEGWSEKYPDNTTFKVSGLLKRMVFEGKLGMKTGEGFYKYYEEGDEDD